MKHINPINHTHATVRKLGGYRPIANKMEALAGFSITRQGVTRWVQRDKIPELWKGYLCMAFPKHAPDILKSGRQ